MDESSEHQDYDDESPKQKVQIRVVLREQDSMSSQRFRLGKRFWIGELERTLSRELGLKAKGTDGDHSDEA